VPFKNKDVNLQDRLDRIEILLDGNFVETEWGQNNTFKRLKQNASFLPKKFREYLELWEYRRRDPRLDSWSGWYYLPTSSLESYSDNRISIINCGGPERIKGNPESIQCQVDYFFRENFLLTYRFYHKNIANWRNIDQEIRKLVQEFITGS
jgi:hypothetical protein